VRVLFDSLIFSAQQYGGISRYFCELATTLASTNKMEIQIIAPLSVNAYLKQLPPDLVSGPSCPKPLLHTKSRWLKLLIRVLAILWTDCLLRIKRPQIIHETYFLPFRLGSRRAKRVLTIYDMIHEKFPHSFSPNDQTANYKKKAAKRADHIICISESTRQDAIQFLNLDPQKVSVIYLGFSGLASKENKYLLPTLPKPYLLFVGNRAGYKNFSLLLEGYAKSSLLQEDYMIVAFGGGAFTNAEQENMQRLGLKSNQVMHYFGDDAQLARFYTGAAVFVYPSLYEGFGIPPLEAMANSCPVVCSYTSSIPEVVGNAGEYFDPTDAQSLIKALETVLTSNTRADELRRLGVERLQSFSWQRCAQETYRIYQQLQ